VANQGSIGSPISVESKEPKRKWTVMVFMGTHTIVGNAPLVQAAVDDIAEMESVGSTDTLNIFVQRQGSGVPRRRHIGHGEEDVPADQQVTTNGAALAAFIQWALTKAGHRSGYDRTLLVLWGHAYQFAIGHVLRPDGSVDALDFGELVEVFRLFQEAQRVKYGLEAAPKLDIIGFDACDVATVEMSCQLQPFADYLLASEMGVPIPGWPYDRILDRLKKPQGDRVMGPAELGSYIVRRYCEAYRSDRPVSLTLLNLQRANELAFLTEALAQRLAIAFVQDPDERDLVFDLFVRSQTDDDKPFVDVADLCLSLIRESGDVFVKQAAEALGDFLISPAPVFPGGSETGAGRPFIVEHGRNACKATKLHGVSLFAPHIALAVNLDDRETELRLYRNFVFARQSLWRQLVENLAGIGEAA
jgi:hypothetical protein